jgi:hypothetical protein
LLSPYAYLGYIGGNYPHDSWDWLLTLYCVHMFGPSLTKLIQYSWALVVALCLPMWVYNSDHGEEHMKGWLFQQGCWGWGCAITWHIIDLGFGKRYCAPEYFWVAHLWKWSPHSAGWDSNLILSVEGVQKEDVEPWMVHSCGYLYVERCDV